MLSHNIRGLGQAFKRLGLKRRVYVYKHVVVFLQDSIASGDNIISILNFTLP